MKKKNYVYYYLISTHAVFSYYPKQFDIKNHTGFQPDVINLLDRYNIELC